ncbi:hypothetical protein SprV_0200768200 [Sparganum proliferum]
MSKRSNPFPPGVISEDWQQHMAEASNSSDTAAGITIIITAASWLTPSENIGSRLVKPIAAAPMGKISAEKFAVLFVWPGRWLA